MEQFGGRMGEYYSKWLAMSVACCIAGPQDRPQQVYVEGEVEEETTMGDQLATMPVRAKTIKRQSPIPGR